MKNFTDAVRKAVEQKNWYSALSSALILPDICGRLVDPSLGSAARYKPWFDQWMGHHYKSEIGPERELHVFLSGSDCYALRCSLLHHGDADIRTQRARKALDDFHFVVTEPGAHVHCNQIENTLQLQTDIFAMQMADAVDAWADSVKDDPVIQKRMQGLLVIHALGNSFSI